MPEPTKEQIEAAKNAIRDSDRLGDCYVILHDAETLLSALESAERERDFLKQRERDICKAVGGVSDDGQYRADVIEHLQIVYKKAQERDVFKARCAELEARLQGAAERAVEWYRREQIYEKRVNMAAVDESGLRAAIVGKEEGLWATTRTQGNY